MVVNEYIENGIIIREVTYDESDLSNDQQREQWISVCNACEFKKKDTCNSCGCILFSLMTYKDSKCPEGKW